MKESNETNNPPKHLQMMADYLYGMSKIVFTALVVGIVIKIVSEPDITNYPHFNLLLSCCIFAFVVVLMLAYFAFQISKKD